VNTQELEELEAGVDDLREPFNVECLSCHKIYVFSISHGDYFDWQHGKHAQYAFPYLTNDERELLMSQTCGLCYDWMFPPEGKK
jgi:hypothetical protein